MGYWLHDRTYDHRGTEDCSIVVLTTDIGRYAAGTLLCDALLDLDRRVSQVDADYIHGFEVFSFASMLAPYDPGTLGGSLLGVFGLEGIVRATASPTLALEAELVSPTPVERTSTFGVLAYISDAGGGPVVQLAAAIDADQTTLTVVSASGFPTSGDYLIQIGAEIMLVTGGQGTTTWTVIRGYNGTTATSHPAGAVTTTC